MQHEFSRGFAALFDGVAKAAVRGMEILNPPRAFSCGDCERNASCGLPPDELCVIKAMQLERDGEEWRPRRPIGLLIDQLARASLAKVGSTTTL